MKYILILFFTSFNIFAFDNDFTIEVFSRVRRNRDFNQKEENPLKGISEIKKSKKITLNFNENNKREIIISFEDNDNQILSLANEWLKKQNFESANDAFQLINNTEENKYSFYIVFNKKNLADLKRWKLQINTPIGLIINIKTFLSINSDIYIKKEYKLKLFLENFSENYKVEINESIEGFKDKIIGFGDQIEQSRWNGDLLPFTTEKEDDKMNSDTEEDSE